MGILGGNKSSSTVDNSQYTSETNDQSFIQAGTLGVRGDNNSTTVNQLDAGAIKDAFTFGQSALDTGMQTYQRLTDGLFDYAKTASDKATDTVNRGIEAANLSAQRVSEAYGRANQAPSPINTNLLLGAAVLLALLMVKK